MREKGSRRRRKKKKRKKKKKERGEEGCVRERERGEKKIVFY
jgi:hypothetical protein